MIQPFKRGLEPRSIYKSYKSNFTLKIHQNIREVFFLYTIYKGPIKE